MLVCLELCKLLCNYCRLASCDWQKADKQLGARKRKRGAGRSTCLIVNLQVFTVSQEGGRWRVPRDEHQMTSIWASACCGEVECHACGTGGHKPSCLVISGGGGGAVTREELPAVPDPPQACTANLLANSRVNTWAASLQRVQPGGRLNRQLSQPTLFQLLRARRDECAISWIGGRFGRRANCA